MIQGLKQCKNEFYTLIFRYISYFISFLQVRNAMYLGKTVVDINRNTFYKISNCFEMKKIEIRDPTKPELHYIQ